MNPSEDNRNDPSNTGVVAYLCITCKWCKAPDVPLQELSPDYCLQSPLPTRFTAHHHECDLELPYDISDLYRKDLKPITNFAPHPAFPRLLRLQRRSGLVV